MASDLSSSAPAPIESPIEATAVHQSEKLPMRWRQALALAAWTALADLAIFRSLGFGGPALFLAFVPLFFFVTEFRGQSRPLAITIGVLLLLVAARLAWSGSGLTIVAGVALVFALSMVARGSMPLVLEGFVLAARVLLDGFVWLCAHTLPRHERNHAAPARSSLTWFLPLAALVVFGGIFVLANPDLWSWVSRRLTQLSDRLVLWLTGTSVWELPFCLTALILGAGLIRPVLPMLRIGPAGTKNIVDQRESAPLFAAYRNTLLTLIVLFAVYLVFEFTTLWHRDFPPGFYYAGYAHQGAAWLTFALALATGLLSLVFSGKTLADPRLGQVRWLTWIWSAQNFLLAAAVYNRLTIYVGYNGMTQLRTVAFFGITVVVIGFVLVLAKIVKNRSFWWLVRGQLIALVLTVISYSLFPVDYVAHRYNTDRVSAGYLHPAVMIAVKPIEDEGVFPLLSLTETADPIIREGVLAMLAQRQLKIEATSAVQWHWTKFQASTDLLQRKLDQQKTAWQKYLQDPTGRQAAIEQFKAYAMQWY